jgi:hypothetical protein
MSDEETLSQEQPASQTQGDPIQMQERPTFPPDPDFEYIIKKSENPPQITREQRPERK